MGSLNKVTLIGRLGKDPETRHFDSGSTKVSFPLATSDSYLDRDGNKIEATEWHNIIVWRKGLTTIAEKYCQKGKEVYIEGRIKTQSWEQDGEKRYRTEIEALSIQLLGNKAETVQDNTASKHPTNDLPNEDDLPF